MKIALPVWNNRIAPVFDAAERWLTVLVSDGKWEIREENTFSGITPEAKAQELLNHNTEYLICGAIPYRLERFLVEAGCGVRSFISGEPERILRAWVDDSLNDPSYCMPGCHGRGQGPRGRFGNRHGHGNRGRGRI